MSENKLLKAVARDRVGKGAARDVRRHGQIPAVIYGGGAAPEAIALDAKEARTLIFAGHFLTTIFDIEVNGRKTRAIPRDYQLDPVKDLPLHVDFLRLSADQAIKVSVPVHVIGQDKSPGIKQGGTLQIVEHTIEMTVPSNAIPESIEVSVAELGIGGVIHLHDVTLPAGAKPSIPGDTTLVSIIGQSDEEEAPAAPAAAAAPEAAKS